MGNPFTQLQLKLGWRDSMPIVGDYQDTGVSWTLPVTPPDGPQVLCVTISVQKRDASRTWRWALCEADDPVPTVIGTGCATPEQALAHACAQVTYRFGVPIDIVTPRR